MNIYMNVSYINSHVNLYVAWCRKSTFSYIAMIAVFLFSIQYFVSFLLFYNCNTLMDYIICYSYHLQP